MSILKFLSDTIISLLIKIYCIIFFVCCSHKMNERVQISVRDVVRNNSLDFSKFIGVPLVTFIETPPFNSYKDYYWFDEPPGLINGITFFYNDSLHIEIIIREFQNMKRFDSNRNWKFTEILKENISIINIYEEKNNINRLLIKRIAKPNGY